MALDALRLRLGRRSRLGRDRGGPRPGEAHPQGPPGARTLRVRAAPRLPARSTSPSTRAPADPGLVRTFVAAWPDEPTRQRLAALAAGATPRTAAGGTRPLARDPALPRRRDRGQLEPLGPALQAGWRPAAGRPVPAGTGHRLVLRGAGPAAPGPRARRAGRRGDAGPHAHCARAEPVAGRRSTVTSRWPGSGAAGPRGPGSTGGDRVRRHLRCGGGRSGGL